MPPKIGIIGVSGNIGKQLKILISENPDIEYAGGISTDNSTHSDFAKLCSSSNVIIDFSSATSIDTLLTHAIKANIALVIGTTGYTNSQTEQILKASQKIPIFYSSNFSIGLYVVKKLLKTLSTDLAEKYSIDIFEWHRSDKKDSPSGTALSLIDEIKKHSNQSVNVTSTRAGSNFCEHTIYFTNSAERIALKHEVYDKKTFAISALSAALFILSQETGYYEMKDLIGNSACMI